jgi:hypothetical protein
MSRLRSCWANSPVAVIVLEVDGEEEMVCGLFAFIGRVERARYGLVEFGELGGLSLFDQG